MISHTHHILRAIMAVMFIAVAFAEEPEFPPLFGSTPPPAVKNWIKYAVVGPRNSEFPIVFISTEKLDIRGYFESLILLRSSGFDVVAKFTQMEIDRSDCIYSNHSIPASYAVEISGKSRGKKLKCVVPKQRACRYFRNILRLPHTGLFGTGRMVITSFARSINCIGL